MCSRQTRDANRRGQVLTESVILLLGVAITLLLAATWMGWRWVARTRLMSASLDAGEAVPGRSLKDESEAFRRLTGAPPSTTDPRRVGDSNGHEWDPNDVAWTPELDASALPSPLTLEELLAAGMVSHDTPPQALVLPPEIARLMDVLDEHSKVADRETAMCYYPKRGEWWVGAFNYETGEEDHKSVAEFVELFRANPAAYMSPERDKSVTPFGLSGEGKFHTHGSGSDGPLSTQPHIERAPSDQDMNKVGRSSSIDLMQFDGQRYALVRTDRAVEAIDELRKPGKDDPFATPPSLGDLVAEHYDRYRKKGFPQEAAQDLAIHEAARRAGFLVYRGTSGGALYRANPRW